MVSTRPNAIPHGAVLLRECGVRCIFRSAGCGYCQDEWYVKHNTSVRAALTLTSRRWRLRRLALDLHYRGSCYRLDGRCSLLATPRLTRPCSRTMAHSGRGPLPATQQHRHAWCPEEARRQRRWQEGACSLGRFWASCKGLADLPASHDLCFERRAKLRLEVVRISPGSYTLKISIDNM